MTVARILTLEQGKPFAEEAVDDIAESGDYFQIAAEDVKRLSGEYIPTTERTRRMFTVHRPGRRLGCDHTVELPRDDPDGVRRSRAWQLATLSS